MATKSLANRNNSISYIKGCAILGVILIHLIDWSEVEWPQAIAYLKNLLYPFVMLFIATAGSLMVIASRKYDMWTATKRIMKRGAEIFAVYFLYNIAKLYLYDFHKQPFYEGAYQEGTLNLANVLALKTYTVPIPILLTIAVYIFLSPALLLILRRIRFPKTFLLTLVALLLVCNYATVIPKNPVSDLLYSKDYVLFPIALWLVPFLLGMYFGLLDLERHKLQQIKLWGVLTFASGAWWFVSGHENLQPSSAMYPLHPYYISFSFLVMFGLIIGFGRLEKLRHPLMQRALSTLKMYGDNTLQLYILHWVVIDLTSWLLFPNLAWLWLIMPVFFIAYSFCYRNKINRYMDNFAAA